MFELSHAAIGDLRLTDFETVIKCKISYPCRDLENIVSGSVYECENGIVTTTKDDASEFNKKKSVDVNYQYLRLISCSAECLRFARRCETKTASRGSSRDMDCSNFQLRHADKSQRKFKLPGYGFRLQPKRRRKR
jgi:hypothetical protein